MYTRQSDTDVDRLGREGRGRFNTVHLVSRHDGVRGLIRHLRNGIPAYYLTDMDFGLNGAAFIPFFGVSAATLLATTQIANTWDAHVVPDTSRMAAYTGPYTRDVLAPLGDFPGDQTADQATAVQDKYKRDWENERE